jgi:hypothetical protein
MMERHDGNDMMEGHDGNDMMGTMGHGAICPISPISDFGADAVPRPLSLETLIVRHQTLWPPTSQREKPWQPQKVALSLEFP